MILFDKICLSIYCRGQAAYEKAKQENNLQCCYTSGQDVVCNGVILNNPANRERVKIGEKTRIDGIVQSYYDKGYIEIGSMSYIGPNTRIWAFEYIKIGKNVLISHNCNVFDSNCHPIDAKERREDYERLLLTGEGNLHGEVVSAPVIIEDDVWIGANACIMKGVHLGARTIVASGAVVTKSFPADVMVAGNPAKIVKRLIVAGDAY